MRRREFIGALTVGLAAGVAGCNTLVGSDHDDPGDPLPDPDPDPEPIADADGVDTEALVLDEDEMPGDGWVRVTGLDSTSPGYTTAVYEREIDDERFDYDVVKIHVQYAERAETGRENYDEALELANSSGWSVAERDDFADEAFEGENWGYAFLTWRSDALVGHVYAQRTPGDTLEGEPAPCLAREVAPHVRAKWYTGGDSL